jgi:hypothetical protein
MRNLVSLRVAALSACIGGGLLAVSGALQATGLDWTENAVETSAQHVTMALFAAAFVALVPAVAYLGRLAPGRGRIGWIGIAAGQLGVAAASTASNIRGVDAAWFPAAAVTANALWIVGTLVLAVALFRSRRVPRLLAVGLVVAYVGSIPLSIVGGGIVAGAYWFAVAFLFGLGAGYRPTLVQPSSV